MRLTLTIQRNKDRLFSAVILGACLGSVLFSLWVVSGDAPAREVTLEGATVARPVPELPPAWPMSLASRSTREVEGEFRPGDTFSSVLRSAGIAHDLVEEIVRGVRDDFDVQRIRAGRPYEVYFGAADEMLLFRYRPDRQTAILIAHGRAGWRAEHTVIPYDIRPRFVHADIRGSLEGSIAGTWVSRRDAINLARKLVDVFAWNVDFAADLRVNDHIDVLVEQRFLEGEFVGFGEVLAADLSIKGREFQAVRYARGGGSSAYFTPDGESLQRAFLRSPVDYLRISSRFSYRRMHPVLNVVRPHRGVDYVAPAGTPVHATAQGTVVYVGRTGQAGNHVKIRHGGAYVSSYLHLRGFASGLKVGDQVEQGEVIGYVGSTGLATSAHLHYQLERNGQFVDPLKIDLPAAEPLPAAHMAEFSKQRDRWISLLRRGQLGTPAILAGSSE